MKKRIAAGVLGTICVLGLAYIPASPLEPGFEKTKVEEDSPGWNCHTMGNKRCGKLVSVVEAENAASKALQDLIPFCKAQGKGAEAWAEINSTQPKGYEVIGECTGP